jgi:hypothetical protein
MLRGRKRVGIQLADAAVRTDDEGQRERVPIAVGVRRLRPRPCD